jgi:hypothetical protein
MPEITDPNPASVARMPSTSTISPLPIIISNSPKNSGHDVSNERNICAKPLAKIKQETMNALLPKRADVLSRLKGCVLFSTIIYG